MALFWLALIVPGFIVAYAMLLRPILHKVSALKNFYTESDSFWSKVWAMCDKSVTMLWGYVLGGLGTALSLIDPIASALGDPNLSAQITTALQGNPKYLGYFVIGASVITLLARLRSLPKAT